MDTRFFSATLSGMNAENLELRRANVVLDTANIMVMAEPENDRSAMIVAIIVRALELATTDLSPRNRAALFLGEEQ